MSVETFISAKELARLMSGKSIRTVYRWVESGLFPRPISLGHNSVGWPESWYQEWAKMKIEGQPESAILEWVESKNSESHANAA